MFLSLLLSGFLTFVELNCENLFDTRHDSLKQDTEFLPEGVRHWTPQRYWRKLNNVGQEILSCSDELPDLVALCEVESDTVLHDLTRRSLLRGAGYEYLMTESPDVRGLDVALLYQPSSFLPICYETLSVEPMEGMRPTRDILYVKGLTGVDDTLHLFVVHAPSRYGGERISRPYRMRVAERLASEVKAIGDGQILIAGDFNDYADDAALRHLERLGLTNVSKKARGWRSNVKGNYRHEGRWRSLDHVLVSASLRERVAETYINDADFLLEEEPQYGGMRPHRTFRGYRYQNGYSDHLPLVVRFRRGGGTQSR